MAVENTKRVADPAPGPLFIVSVWRGGSSLLYALLNKHPQIGLMYEADLVLLRPVFLKPAGVNDWAERWELWNEALSRHGLDGSEFAAEIPEFRNALEAVHKEYARRKGAVIWGDKSPNYHDQLEQMAKDFPRARFLIVWRNPLGTIGSTIRAAATGNSYFRKRGMPLRSLLGYRTLKSQCGKIVAAGAAVHQVHYEDLVSDTANVIRGVCEFLGVRYDDSLCTLEGADRSAVYEGRHHTLLGEDVIFAGPRPDVIETSLRLKIEHYMTLWRETDPEEYETDSPGKTPTAGEMRADLIRYRLCRTLDAFIRLAFCFLPIPLLRLYRKVRTRAHSANAGRDAVESLPARSLRG